MEEFGFIQKRRFDNLFYEMEKNDFMIYINKAKLTLRKNLLFEKNNPFQ